MLWGIVWEAHPKVAFAQQVNYLCLNFIFGGTCGERTNGRYKDPDLGTAVG